MDRHAIGSEIIAYLVKPEKSNKICVTIVYKQYILIIINSFRHQNKLPLRGKFFTKTHSTTPSEVLSCPFQLHSLHTIQPVSEDPPGRSGGKRDSCADPLRIPLHDRGSVPYVLLRAAVDRRFFRPQTSATFTSIISSCPISSNSLRDRSHSEETVPFDPRALLPLRRGSWPFLA